MSKHQRIKKLFVGLSGLVWLCEETLEQLDEVLVATVGPVEVGELVNELGELEVSDRWELRSCWIWWCSPDLAADRAAAAAAMDWCCNRYEAGKKKQLTVSNVSQSYRFMKNDCLMIMIEIFYENDWLIWLRLWMLSQAETIITIHPVLGSCVFFRSGKNPHEPNPQH